MQMTWQLYVVGTRSSFRKRRVSGVKEVCQMETKKTNILSTFEDKAWVGDQ